MQSIVAQSLQGTSALEGQHRLTGGESGHGKKGQTLHKIKKRKEEERDSDRAEQVLGDVRAGVSESVLYGGLAAQRKELSLIHI